MCGVLFSEITGATGDGIEAGAMNTMLIISAQREDEDSATRLCADLEEGGYGDWYLPSKDELDLMWKNLYRFSCPNVAPDSSPCPTALGGFAASIYWISSLAISSPALRASPVGCELFGLFNYRAVSVTSCARLTI